MSFLHRIVRRPVATLLIAAVVLMLGLAAGMRMPLSTLPVVDLPSLLVVSTLPGASAETVSTSVTTPLERELTQVVGVSEMTSTSSSGVSSIFLQFASARGSDTARRDVDAAISNALVNLPADMPRRPEVVAAQPPDGQMISVAVSSTTLPLTSVDSYARTYVAQRLAHVPGVGGIDIHGSQQLSIRVSIDALKLAARGITFEQVRSALVGATAPTPSATLNGSLSTQDFDIARGALQSKDFAALHVPTGSSGPLTLADLGTATSGALNANDRAWAQGRRAIVLDLYRQPGAKVLDTIAEIHRQLADMQRELPPSLQLTIVGDRTQSVLENVGEATRTLVLTIGVVVLVVAAFLRNARLVLIPIVAIPLSLSGAAALSFLAGYGINTLTLIAIIVAVGFVIDDAIVVFENIVRHAGSGESLMTATLRGTREVAFTVLSMTFSLVAALVPLMLMEGSIGDMFHEFAFAIGSALLCSAVVSLTITPVMCFYLVRSHAAHRPTPSGKRHWFSHVDLAYGRMLNWTLRHRGIMGLATLASLPLTVAVFMAIPKGFFPDQDTGLVLCNIQGPADINPATMAHRAEELMQRLMEDPSVATVHGWLDASSTNSGTIIVGLKPYDERHDDIRTVVQHLRSRAGHPVGLDLRIRARQDLRAAGRPGRTTITYAVQSTDEALLYRSLPRIVTALKALPQLKDVVPDIPGKRGKASLEIDADRANALGVAPQAVDEILRDALAERQVGTVFTGVSSWPVILELTAAQRMDPQSLALLTVGTSTEGAVVPLGAFTRIRRTEAPLEVDHRDQFTSLDLGLVPADGVSFGEAVSSVESAVSRLGLPAGLHGSFEGNAKAFQLSVGSQPLLILAAILLVYVVLGVLYESLIHPLTILSTLPSAGLGALLTVWACEHELNLISMIGLILLIGIVKKNAIMIVDTALTGMRNDALSPLAAIRGACATRFRPIMMTTFAALLGALPLVAGSGIGSELRRPIGVAILGGLLLSQFVTLFTTPVVFLYFADLSDKFNVARNRQTAIDDPSSAA